MRKVNIITYDLIKAEFNIKDIPKGERINIISTQNVWNSDLKNVGKTKHITIKAR